MGKLFKAETTWLKGKDLDPNPVQPADRIRDTAIKTLRETIVASHVVTPIAVAKSDKRGKYIILDGHRRVGALTELGWDDEIECKVLPTTGPYGTTPEIWFILLNGGIRNVSGTNWFHVWAASDDPTQTLEKLNARVRSEINEMVDIFGLERAIEIGRESKLSPNRSKFINALIAVMTRYGHIQGTQTQRRRVGEWVIEHKQTNAINQEIIRKTPTARTAAKFFNAIQRNRPADKRVKSSARPRQMADKEGE